MDLLNKIDEDLKTAMRAKDEFATSVLRMLRSAIKNAEIAKRPEQLNEEDILKSIKSEVKKLKDALGDFEKARRDDLINKTKKEIEFLGRYLPGELPEEQIEEIVRRVINIMKPSGPQDFGRIMGSAMKEIAGRVSGDAVAKIVRKLLG